MTRWRKRGIESTRKAAIRIAAGFGPSSDESRSNESFQDILEKYRVGRKLMVGINTKVPCLP